MNGGGILGRKKTAPAVLDSVCFVPLPNDVTMFYVALLICVNSPNGNESLAFFFFFFLLDILWKRLVSDSCKDVKIGCLGSKPRFVETNFRAGQLCSHHKSTTSREKNKIGKLGNGAVVKNVFPHSDGLLISVDSPLSGGEQSWR